MFLKSVFSAIVFTVAICNLAIGQASVVRSSAVAAAPGTKLNALEIRRGRELSVRVEAAERQIARRRLSINTVNYGNTPTSNHIEESIHSEQSERTEAQAALTDWEAQTLKAHKADSSKTKIDWTRGQIVAK